MKKKVLGRGLEALIPEASRPEPATSEIDIDLIAPNPDQPRFKLDEKGLEELAASIRENGVLQPILVRPADHGYQLVAGERRLAAAQRAGLLKIPVIVREVPDERLLELALVENIQREQLNPIEEAQAYQHLTETLGATQEELATRLGKERSTIANSIRLLKLPPAVRQLVAEGPLSPGHARALLASDAPAAEMLKMANHMVAQGWSVRDAERWAKARPRTEPPPKTKDPNEAAAEDRLRLLLGTKVEIHGGRGSKGAGQIRIYFYNQDDLVRLYTLLTEKRA
jgi:ParB family chromosome partitioning protein